MVAAGKSGCSRFDRVAHPARLTFRKGVSAWLSRLFRSRSPQRGQVWDALCGEMKTVGGGRKMRYCGIARNRRWAEMTIAGYNLFDWRNSRPPQHEPWDRSVLNRLTMLESS